MGPRECESYLTLYLSPFHFVSIFKEFYKPKTDDSLLEKASNVVETAADYYTLSATDSIFVWNN